MLRRLSKIKYNNKFYLVGYVSSAPELQSWEREERCAVQLIALIHCPSSCRQRSASFIKRWIPMNLRRCLMTLPGREPVFFRTLWMCFHNIVLVIVRAFIKVYIDCLGALLLYVFSLQTVDFWEQDCIFYLYVFSSLVHSCRKTVCY